MIGCLKRPRTAIRRDLQHGVKVGKAIAIHHCCNAPVAGSYKAQSNRSDVIKAQHESRIIAGMDQARATGQFDWIAWLATIPGVPSDWGAPAPQPEMHEPDDAPDDHLPPMLKAA
jgi:hypothetical protein